MNQSVSATAKNAPLLLSPTEVAGAYVGVAQQASRLLAQYAKKKLRQGAWFPSEELAVARSFMDLSARLFANPYRLAQTQMAMMRDYVALWQQSMLKSMGMPSLAVALPARSDRRFDDEAWEENFLFDFIKQSYLITASHLHGLAARAEGLDEAAAQRVSSLTRRYVDALAPTNFVLTNPEVLRETVNSQGRNLIAGLKRLLHDLETGVALSHLAGRDETGLTPAAGRAHTPGKVVFQNELLQLIQFAPAGGEQYRMPLLIVPPWNEAYGLFDLSAERSLVGWTTGQGFTTFVVSWRTDDDSLTGKGFADYLSDGLLAAVDAVEQGAGATRIHLAGYGLGGTLLMAALAWLAARRDKRIASATFLATLIDFAQPGEPEAVAADEGGRGPGPVGEDSASGEPAGAAVDRMLRSNDLIWSFVVDHYLLGRETCPPETLNWNIRPTPMAAGMRGFYRESLVRTNRLPQPGGLLLDGVALDIARVKVPCYFLATLDDQVSPWRSVYAGARLLRAPLRFVLAGSGHVAGVINSPLVGQYAYWTNEPLPRQADEFLTAATRHPGSWWVDWRIWLCSQPRGEAMVAARQPGSGGLPVIEDAPGSYAARPAPAKEAV